LVRLAMSSFIETGECDPGAQSIADGIGTDARQAKRLVRQLETLGFIQAERREKRKGYNYPNHYRFRLPEEVGYSKVLTGGTEYPHPSGTEYPHPGGTQYHPYNDSSALAEEECVLRANARETLPARGPEAALGSKKAFDALLALYRRPHGEDVSAASQAYLDALAAGHGHDAILAGASAWVAP
jgi:hypothetical protein